MKNGSTKKSGKRKGESKGSGGRDILNSLDKVLNTPTATKHLLEESLDSSFVLKQPKSKGFNIQEKITDIGSMASQTKNSIKKSISDSVLKKVSASKVTSQSMEDESSNDETATETNILRKGIKFPSQNSFLRFINMPSKGGRNKKRKLTDPCSPPPHNGAENDAFETSAIQSEEKESPERKRKKLANNKSYESLNESTSDKSLDETTDSVHHRLNKSRIREILSSTRSEGSLSSMDESRYDQKNTSTSSKKKTFLEKAKDKLLSSRFRYINEKLYTQTSEQSIKMFKKDSSLFEAYHQGFQLQAGSWPSDPLDTIIESCKHLPDSDVVADMGCGDARLARSIPNTVHSFDLVSNVAGVISCDMSSVPLPDESVDVVVFCLSLMGTNIKDFLFEAGRILKMGGVMKIAELESRLQTLEVDFIKKVWKYGFQMNWKNLKNKYFVFFDFKKVRQVKNKKKVPAITLKPCLYKKR